jgi:membrane-associated HD superfamily phosphohydrolase
MTAMLFLPLAVMQTGESYGVINVFGLTNNQNQFLPTWGLFILTTIIIILALTSLILYKKRMLQIRFCIFNGIIMLGFYGLFVFTVYALKQSFPDSSLNVKIALAFPLISLILDYIAIRNIGADEVLVRSLDRLR